MDGSDSLEQCLTTNKETLMKRKTLTIYCAVLAVALGGALSLAAQAQMVNVGTRLNLVDVAFDPFAAISAGIGGSTVASSISLGKIKGFEGTFRTQVMDGPEPGVNLDFYYQYENQGFPFRTVWEVTLPIEDSFSASAAQRYQLSSFPENVFYQAGDFEWADRQIANQITFRQDPERHQIGLIGPGEITRVMVIRTSATGYTEGIAEIPFTDRSGQSGIMYFGTFQPAVPEPGTNALMVAGLGLMGFVFRRHRKAVAGI
jgi:hypothetical protein